jgi:cysteine desulfurase
MAVYLDCASTTPVHPVVRAAATPFLDEEYGNASSRTHQYGGRARAAVEHARGQVAAAAGCARGEVVFTSGATESNNLAILGLEAHGRETGRTHLVSTQIEHNAVLEPLQELARRGFALTLVPPTPGGWVDPRDVAAAVRPDTLLVSVMSVNNETGVIQPVADIARLLASHPAYLHVDAAQGFGHELSALRDPRIDLLSVSGHKVHAFKGVGALIARRRCGERPPLRPLLFGGGQERGLRPGTLPVHLIVGIGAASELAVTEHAERRRANLAFRGRLEAAIRELDPLIAGDQTSVVPHILNVAFPGVDAEMAMEAQADVVAVSNGSACTAQARVCSHVLSAMGRDGAYADGALRFSWCHMTPEPDWPAMVRILRQLRDAGPQ